jgi:hypothetical protein
MTTTTHRWALAISIAVGLVCSRPVFGCGPFFEQAIFTYSLHPDLPLAGFAQGQLGVLQPTYARSYLYAAYRHLSGVGFTADEQQALLALWDQRLQPPPDHWHAHIKTAMNAWYDARAQVTGNEPPPAINVFKTLEARNGQWYFHQYVNCTADAFLTAAQTLRERAAQFGADSVAIQDWVRAQDQVFSNCSGEPSIPHPTPPQSPALLRADRAYQIAAAHFYAGHFATAEQLFRDIADDPSSPWRPIAPYLEARTFLRRGSLVPRYDEVERGMLSEAERKLDGILGDSNLQAVHPAANRLLAVVRFRLDPDARMHELAQRLLMPNIGATLKQELWDYTLLLDQAMDDRDAARTRQARRDELTDWLLTFQDQRPSALAHAVDRWTATAAHPWLIAALAKIGPGHAQLPALLTAAEHVPREAPAFASVEFHRLRLLAATGQREEVRQHLEDLLADAGPTFPPSARNLLRALRLRLARNLDEFLSYAPRIPVAITYNIDGRELPTDVESNERLKLMARDRPLFDEDAARILNRHMPLGMLREAVHRGVLPSHLRRELAMAVLVRSLVLGEEATLRNLVPVIKNLIPELGPYLDEYRATVNREARTFGGILMLLRFPGLKPSVPDNVGRVMPLDHIDNYRDNWWCAITTATSTPPRDADRLSSPLEQLYPDGQEATLEFLHPEQTAAAHQELQRLAALGTAPNYLSQQVIAWGQKASGDSRVPEALHLAVKATRVGCTDADTGKLSKAAFELLHQRYPKSLWAQKTPYWYK